MLYTYVMGVGSHSNKFLTCAVMATPDQLYTNCLEATTLVLEENLQLYKE